MCKSYQHSCYLALGFTKCIAIQPIPDSTLAPLQQAQNSAARLLCGVRRCEHITWVLQKLHWLSVKKRIVYNILVLVLYGLSAPIYMSECLTQYRSFRNLRLASLPLQLQVPRTSKTVVSQAFAMEAQCPTAWSETHSDQTKSETYLFGLTIMPNTVNTIGQIV